GAAQRGRDLALRRRQRRYGGMDNPRRPAAANVAEWERRYEPGRGRRPAVRLRPPRRSPGIRSGHRARAREARVRRWPLEQPDRGGREDRAAGRQLERSRDERNPRYLAAAVTPSI